MKPHPKALERHESPCRNETLHDWADLHRLAGKYDAYPVTAPTVPDACPTCGSPDLPPLALYCSDACRKTATKRVMSGMFQRRGDDDITPYNW